LSALYSKIAHLILFLLVAENTGVCQKVSHYDIK